MDALIGQQWGSYRLIRLLGRGGFAEVYLGEHIHLGMQAAIKILRASLSEKATRSFQQEACIIAELAHPHIVRVLDFDIQDGRPFLVLEYAPDGALNQKHPYGTKLPLPVVVEYVSQVAGPLQYAHDKRLVHRDVKPENMLIGRQGELLLSDFGIATIAHSTLSMDTQGFQGTLAYIAPEQIQGHPRAASDQYALGVVAYQWLTGNLPFQGSSSEIIAQHLGVAPRSLRDHEPQVSQEIEEIIQKAMAKDPRARFENVFAFADALQQASQAIQSVTGSVAPTDRQADFPTLPLHALTPQAIHTTPDTPQPVPARVPATPAYLDISTSQSPEPAGTPGTQGQAKGQPTVTMTTMGLPLLPVSLSHDEAPGPRRSRSRRVILSIAAIGMLIAGTLALWYALPSFSRSRSPGPHSPFVNRSIDINPGVQAGTENSNHLTPAPGTGRDTPTSQAAGVSPTSSVPASQSPSTPVLDCLGGSPGSITITQLLGAKASLPGTAIKLASCSPISGHWTATVQIDKSSGWTSCVPSAGDLAAHATQTVHVVVGSPNVLAGTYTARWIFTLGSASWTLKVTLIVIA